MSDHYAVWSDGYLTMECGAPAAALCHARFDCDCETYLSFGQTLDGRPFHVTEGNQRHDGVYVPGWCGLAEWFEEDDTAREQFTLRVPVLVDWSSFPAPRFMAFEAGEQ